MHDARSRQTEKNSARANVFRVTPESGHYATQSACLNGPIGDIARWPNIKETTECEGLHLRHCHVCCLFEDFHPIAVADQQR
jgi:hypothetical protein